MNVGELFFKLGFAVEDKGLTTFNNKIQNTLFTLTKITGVSLGVAGFKALLDKAASSAVALDNLSFKYGVATDRAQRFSSALMKGNPALSREGALGIYDRLTDLTQKFSINGVGKLAQFGVTSLDNTPEKLRAKISENFDDVANKLGSRAAAAELVKEATGADEALQAFLFSAEKFDQAGNKFKIPEEDIKSLRDYAAAMRDLTDSLSILSAKTMAEPIGNLNYNIKQMQEKGVVHVMGSLLGDAAKDTVKAYSDFYANLGNHAIDFLEEKGILPKADASKGEKSSRIFDGGNSFLSSNNSQKSIGQSAREYFESMGWTAPQSAGIVNRLGLESYAHLDPAAVGDGGDAYGIAQWHPDRQADFEKWAGHSIKGSSREEQLGFVNYELTQGNERAAGNLLRKAQNEKQSYDVFTNNYERPAKSKPMTIDNLTVNINTPSIDPQKHAAEFVRTMQQTNLAGAY